ncbi:MAG: hypothetical protein CRN43_19395 [Candidatus Nephrothrix sp. EaCA]|nr:MAG: hypothetical protein CRN43_19395 [Candidatus Nephrothrix sp. EaCA]
MKTGTIDQAYASCSAPALASSANGNGGAYFQTARFSKALAFQIQISYVTTAGKYGELPFDNPKRNILIE